MTRVKKEKQFTALAGAGLCTVLVVLAALGLLPYITSIALILFVVISLFLVDQYIEDLPGDGSG